jgi:acyl dehydratase
MNELYLEDLTAGAVYSSPARTITETDLVNFAGLSGDYNRIHTDAEYSRSTEFGQRVVHGLLGMAVVTGLLHRTGLFDGSVVAMLGIREWRFVAPLFVGDTVHARMRIVSVRPLDDGLRGVVCRWFQLINQRGTVVQEGEMNAMVMSRASLTDGSSAGSADETPGGEASDHAGSYHR